MEFDELLITWYLREKRDLPWRNTSDPYRIWLSEIILQQTRVEQGLPYYLRFLNSFPRIGILAKADEEEVLKLWQGLGYYSRARNLHHTAKYVYHELKGVFPKSYGELRRLKGVGPYTAAAIASFAYGLPHAVIDGNVSRVLSRLFDLEAPVNSTQGKKQLEYLSERCLSKDKPDLYNQAIMELGALVCTPKNPRCTTCPVNEKCMALQAGTIEERPVKLKKSKPKKRRIDYAVIEAEDYFIMRKRQENDIWQGLYDFASVEDQEEVTEESILKLVQNTFPELRIESIDTRPEKTYTHILSHRRIEANFWRLKVDGVAEERVPYRKVEKDAIDQFAVPRLIHRFLDESCII